MAGGGGDRPVKLVVEQASKLYETRSGRALALDRFSMAVRRGELVCVIGPSGSAHGAPLVAEPVRAR